MVLIKPEEKSNEGDGGSNTAVKVKSPKRVLHFSDGILEEYSDDEEVKSTPKEEQELVDPSTLTWGPWFWYKAWAAGTSTLSIIDYIGESLASFFGITTPKYYYELEEYKRIEAERKENAEQAKGWSTASDTEGIQLNDIATKQPEPVHV